MGILSGERMKKMKAKKIQTRRTSIAKTRPVTSRRVTKKSIPSSSKSRPKKNPTKPALRKVPPKSNPSPHTLKTPAKTLVYEEAGVIVRLNTAPVQKHHGPEKREPVEHVSVEEVKRAIHEAVGGDLQDIDKEFLVKKQCIVCGAQAAYRIKARPSDTYCKDCALEYFKFLTYLEKI